MNKVLKSKNKLLLLALILTNIVTAGLYVRSLYYEYLWRQEMSTTASYAAALQSSADIRRGRLRVFEISFVKEEDDDNYHSHFTGRSDGPFQIWTWPCFPELGQPHEFSTQQFIQSYNTITKDRYTFRQKKLARQKKIE